MRADDTLVDEMFAEALDDLHLLFRGESVDGGFDDAANRSLVDGDETVKMVSLITRSKGRLPMNVPLVVHVSEEAHDELTIHAVGHSTVTRDRIAKVLDVESALEA